MSLPAPKDFKAPGKYVVYVEVNKPLGGTKPFIGRLGPADNLTTVGKLIQEDKRAMSDTLGGLIDAPGSRHRTYRVFEAVWKEVTEELSL